MTIKDFAEWKEKVHEEYMCYRRVYPFLDEEGMCNFVALSDIDFVMEFCSSAKEMVETIEHEVDGKTHRHAKNTIYYNALKMLAKREG